MRLQRVLGWGQATLGLLAAALIVLFFSERRARLALLEGSGGATLTREAVSVAARYDATSLAIFVAAIAVIAAILGIAARRLRTQGGELRGTSQRLGAQGEELSDQVAEARALAHELMLSNADLNSAVDAAVRSHAMSEVARSEKDQALAFLDAALNGAPVGFAFYDLDLRFTRINEALAVINGAPAASHIGRTVRQMLPELADYLEPLLRGVLTTGTPLRDLEITGETPAAPGETRHWLATYYPVIVGGRTTGVGVVLIETTAIKRLEAQLRQSQKMEAIGQLAGGIAHDFNNMLAAIKSYSELVLGQTSPDDQRYGDVLEIRAAADRAAALTRQLLAFSRKQILRPELVDLNLLVQNLGMLLERVIGVDVACRMTLADDLAYIRADPSQVEQVLMNLAVNARDAMPHGGNLTIETANVDLQEASDPAPRFPGPHVRLSVTDTGTGIAAGVRERIFEPFFTTKEPGKGTGLGLATVYGIVEQSGGCLSVDTTPGAGTTFHICFPADRSSFVAAAMARPPLEEPANGHETVLLIEDDPAVLAVAARILRAQGYDVLEADTPRAAEEIAERHAEPIHLILTDLMLPEMNGRELAVRLRVRHPAARLLYMSGYADEEVMRDSPLDPTVPFLAKPFTVEAMASKVREALSA